MKRDMDLVRELLLRFEGEERKTRLRDVTFDDREPREIDDHLHILDDAGLIRIAKNPDGTFSARTVVRLTWSGHDFLDAARDQDRWDQAKALIADKATAVPFEVLKATLVSLAMKAVGLG